MALYPCPQCGKYLDESADRCPQCRWDVDSRVLCNPDRNPKLAYDLERKKEYERERAEERAEEEQRADRQRRAAEEATQNSDTGAPGWLVAIFVLIVILILSVATAGKHGAREPGTAAYRMQQKLIQEKHNRENSRQQETPTKNPANADSSHRTGC